MGGGAAQKDDPFSPKYQCRMQPQTTARIQLEILLSVVSLDSDNVKQGNSTSTSTVQYTIAWYSGVVLQPSNEY